MEVESPFLIDFKRCVCDYGKETQFDAAWSKLLSAYSVEDDTWLNSLYKVKEKWAACYMKHVLTLGMQINQPNKSINAMVKSFTNLDLDIVQFFENFERAVEGNRYRQSKHFEMRKQMPRLKSKYSPMLQQLVQIYTPTIFDLFQEQWDRSFAALAPHRNEMQLIFEYAVTMHEEEGEWKVSFDPVDKSISCSCKLFESWGILYCHAVKIYDLHDVKILPHQYIY